MILTKPQGDVGLVHPYSKVNVQEESNLIIIHRVNLAQIHKLDLTKRPVISLPVC